MELVTQKEIHAICEEMEPAIRKYAHLSSLPYMPLIPSLRAFALLNFSWESFTREYKRALIVAIHSGQSYAYMD